jgi:8-hydroxy-5-deazaflavin:NADPH oxidoreductase
VRISVLGRRWVGGGLAALWRNAGHEVTTFGREGGDAMAADVLVVVPGAEIADALGKMHGIEGKVAIDVTNSYSGRDEQFESNAHQVKSITGGPVPKTFNTNFAAPA